MGREREKKTNIDLAKMISDCAIYIHIFSRNKYRRERPPDPNLQEGARSSL